MFALVVAASAPLARANTIQVANSAFTDTDADGNFEFNYSAALVNVPPSEIRTNDFFVIYDFAGFTGQAVTPAGWTVQWVFNPGVTTFEPAITNDPGIKDLVFTYTGATITTSGSLGPFAAETTEKFFILDGYQGHDHNSVLNQEQNNFGTLFVPTADITNGTPVPLPAAAWAGMALFGVIGGVRMKKKSLA